jgi:predicted HNH restriction endonuclease
MGRQILFCSRICKSRYANYHHQSYVKQAERARDRKLKLVKQLGGGCQQCGYSRNLAAMEFHHRDPQTKNFQLDARTLANRDWREIETEAKKCELLCSNCHAEVHNPRSALP